MTQWIDVAAEADLFEGAGIAVAPEDTADLDRVLALQPRFQLTSLSNWRVGRMGLMVLNPIRHDAPLNEPGEAFEEIGLR